MFFSLFSKKRKISNKIQKEYIDSVKYILNSPLWNGTDAEIYNSLPIDLTAATIEAAKKELLKGNS